MSKKKESKAKEAPIEEEVESSVTEEIEVVEEQAEPISAELHEAQQRLERLRKIR